MTNVPALLVRYYKVAELDEQRVGQWWQIKMTDMKQELC